eukprot:s31_g9.t1
MDHYFLHSYASLPHSLENVNVSGLFEVGLAAKESSQPRFSKAAGQSRISFFLDSLDQRKSRPRSRIALFVQMHNANMWPLLYPCIQNVMLAADTSHSVDVFVITTSEDSAAKLQDLGRNLSAFVALRSFVLAVGANKGADIGLFLQQLLMNLELQLDFDILFKLHSKAKESWRNLLVESLCGNVEVVRRNVEALQDNPNIGLIGPSKLTWGPDSQSFIELDLKKYGFTDLAIRGMNTTWSILGTGSTLPAKRHWMICAGSFFWVPASYISVWQEQVVSAAPRILAMSAIYTSGCNQNKDITCVLATALETWRKSGLAADNLQK